MKVLYLHPKDGENLGDVFTLEGSKHFITKAIGIHEVIIADLHEIETNIDTIAEKYSKINIDLLVISGTPWIWDCCTASSKYRGLEKLLAVYKNKKKIALGVGSCFKLTTNILEEQFNNLDKENLNMALKNVWQQFDIIFTRDNLASEILDRLEIPHFNELCTSAQLKKYIEVPKVSEFEKIPSLIFYNPIYGISRICLDYFFIKDYINFQLTFIKEFTPRVYTIERAEQEWLTQRGITAERIVDMQKLLEILNQSKFVLSGRVHAAIPAQILGIDTFIMPVDSRYLTATKLGIIPVFTQGMPYYNFENLHSNHNIAEVIENSEKQIIKEIRKLLGKVNA